MLTPNVCLSYRSFDLLQHHNNVLYTGPDATYFYHLRLAPMYGYTTKRLSAVQSPLPTSFTSYTTKRGHAGTVNHAGEVASCTSNHYFYLHQESKNGATVSMASFLSAYQHENKISADSSGLEDLVKYRFTV